jgi:hypothetical protein
MLCATTIPSTIQETPGASDLDISSDTPPHTPSLCRWYRYLQDIDNEHVQQKSTNCGKRGSRVFLLRHGASKDRETYAGTHAITQDLPTASSLTKRKL